MDTLRRKLTVRAQGQSLVLVKRPIESPEHVLQKALLWAMYLPHYPDVRVEVPLPTPSRYKPDLLALDLFNEPRLWGECGVVSLDKLRFLLTRYKRTHFVFSKWSTRLDPFAGLIAQALEGVQRRATVELINFDVSAVDAIGEDGTITVADRMYERRRWNA